MNWNDLKDAWGLQEIPRILHDRLCCLMCTIPGKGKLYTNQRLPSSLNRRQYEQEIEAARNWAFCKYHAIQFYKD